LERELGIHACGGRGKNSPQTPHQLPPIGERGGFDGAAPAEASRPLAQGDNAPGEGGLRLFPPRLNVARRRPWGRVQPGGERGGGPAATIGCPRGCKASSTSRTPPSTDRPRVRS